MGGSPWRFFVLPEIWCALDCQVVRRASAIYIYDDPRVVPEYVIERLPFDDFTHLISLCEQLKQEISVVDEMSSLRDRVVYSHILDKEVEIKEALAVLFDYMRKKAIGKERQLKRKISFSKEEFLAYLGIVNSGFLWENQIMKIFDDIKPEPGVDAGWHENVVYEQRIAKEAFVGQWQSYGSTIGFEGIS